MTLRGDVLRIGDYPAGGPLAGWLFDCLGAVPVVSKDDGGRVLVAGYTLAELRIVWAWEHRN